MLFWRPLACTEGRLGILFCSPSLSLSAKYHAFMFAPTHISKKHLEPTVLVVLAPLTSGWVFSLQEPMLTTGTCGRCFGCPSCEFTHISRSYGGLNRKSMEPRAFPCFDWSRLRQLRDLVDSCIQSKLKSCCGRYRRRKHATLLINP